MKLCLLSDALAGDDPSDPLAQHPRRLAAREGLDVTVALPERPSRTALGAARLARVDDLANEGFEVALALGWRAALRLYEIEAERYALFVPALDHRTLHAADADRILATLAIDLPLDLIAGADWIAEELRALRPEARVLAAPPGLEHEQFATVRPGARLGGPLHVLVDSRSGASPAAAAAASAMTQAHRVDVLRPGHDGVARAARYLEADVVLGLDAPDGVLGSPLEAMATGVPCVVAVSAACADLVRDGENGVVVPGGDADGAARALDRIAADRDRLARLSAGALATGEAWPGWDSSAAMLAGALAQISAEPPPPAALRPRRLLADADGAVTLFRSQFRELVVAYERLGQDELVRASGALRAAYRSDRLSRVRRAASPLVVRAKRRIGSGG